MTASNYTVGQPVEVFKYGSWYTANVIKVGRTTVTVNFRTKGGKLKIYTVPGRQVDYMLKTVKW